MKWYTTADLARDPDFPFKTRVAVVRLIKEGRLKALVLRHGLPTRYKISEQAVAQFLSGNEG